MHITETFTEYYYNDATVAQVNVQLKVHTDRNSLNMYRDTYELSALYFRPGI